MNKRKITLAVIAMAVLLVALVSATYAYWTLNSESRTSTSTSIQTGGLILRLDDVDGITSNDVISPNNLSFNKYFSITNESAADGYAKLLFKGLTNTFVTDALVYDLEEVQNDKASFATPKIIITNQVLPKGTSINATLADGLLVEKGTIGQNNTITSNTKYYKLTVRYKYSDTVNQSQDLNQTLVSGFTMEEGQSSVTESITFDSKGGLTTPSNISATMGSTYGTLPSIKKTRYIFDGWYTDELYTEKVESDSKVLKNGNHTLYAKWTETLLPEGYTQLDYLESTGAQYIDTELSMPNGFRFLSDIVWTDSNKYNGLIGSQYNNIPFSTNFFGIHKSFDGQEILGAGANYITGFVPDMYTKYTYDVSTISNNIYVKRNGLNISLNLVEFNATAARSNLTIYIFAFHQQSYSDDWFGKVKVYNYLLIYNSNNNLVAKYIPAKCTNTSGCSDGNGGTIANNKVGMYDVVRNRFFTNLGTGTDFTPGEELW